MKMGKKGLGIYDISTICMVLLVAGVTLSIGAYLQNQLGKNTATISTVTNETVSFTNGTYSNVAYNIQSIGVISNYSLALGSANYSYRENGGVSQIKVTFLTSGAAATGLADGNWNVTYNAYSGSAWYVSQNSTGAIAQMSVWLPIIAIVSAAGVILGVLAVAFMRKPEGGV